MMIELICGIIYKYTHGDTLAHNSITTSASTTILCEQAFSDGHSVTSKAFLFALEIVYGFCVARERE